MLSIRERVVNHLNSKSYYRELNLYGEEISLSVKKKNRIVYFDLEIKSKNKVEQDNYMFDAESDEVWDELYKEQKRWSGEESGIVLSIQAFFGDVLDDRYFIQKLIGDAYSYLSLSSEIDI
jgi:hypothetical protein